MRSLARLSVLCFYCIKRCWVHCRCRVGGGSYWTTERRKKAYTRNNMASSREIITVQIGTASNFVGAHWWNIQESSFNFDRKAAEADDTRLNHDVLFREGRNIHNRTTFTPRLVVIDCAESVSRTNLSRNLYPEHASSCADGCKTLGFATTVVNQTSGRKNRFLSDLDEEDKQRLESSTNPTTSAAAAAVARVEDKYYELDDSISTWTDYLRVPFHPKSLLTYQSMHASGPLSRFEYGEDMFKEGEAMFDAFEDRLRFFAEEADCLQGFHFLCDTHDAAGGISKELVRYVEDEYHGKVTFAFAVSPSILRLEDDSTRGHYVWNSASALCALASHCSLVLPVSTAGKLWRVPSDQRPLTYLKFKPELLYHTGAIIATALETVTSPWRRRVNFDRLAYISDTIGMNGRKFASLSLVWPLLLDDKTRLCDYLRNTENPMISLTPHVDASMDEIQINSRDPRILNVSMRGVGNLAESAPAGVDRNAQCLAMSKDLLECFEPTATFTHASSIYEPVYTKSPYPHIFENKPGRGGLSFTSAGRQKFVSSTSTLTVLESSVRVLGLLKAITGELGKLNCNKLRLDKDDFDDTSNTLMNFVDLLRGQDNMM